MTAEFLLNDLSIRGVTLKANGEQLDVEAPGEMLTSDLLATLKTHKDELLALLGQKCDKCAGLIETVTGNNWRHSWCQKGCFDRWEADEGHTLRETAGKPFPDLFDAGRALALTAIEQQICPDCGGGIELQSRQNGGVYWCAICREHFTVSEWLN